MHKCRACNYATNDQDMALYHFENEHPDSDIFTFNFAYNNKFRKPIRPSFPVLKCHFCSFGTESCDDLNEHLKECVNKSFTKPNYPFVPDHIREDMIYLLGQLQSLTFLFADHGSRAHFDFCETLANQYRDILNALLGTQFD